MSQKSTLSVIEPRIFSEMDLNGDWQFQLDPENQGKSAGWSTSLPTPETITNQAPWEYWHPEYDGVAWYQKEVVIPAGWEGQINSLIFDAVAYYCEVWVNDVLVGTHEGAFTGFELILPEELLWDEVNRITVRVINPPVNYELEGFRSGGPLNQSNLPTGKMAWYFNFGGIWQSVRLRSRPRLCIDSIRVLPQVAANRLKVRLGLINRPEVKDLIAKCRILDSAGNELASFEKAVADQGETPQAEWEIPLDDIPLQTWSPENPEIYQFEATVQSPLGTVSRLTERFGFREFTIVGKQFFLNGKRVILKGFLQQGVYPRTLAIPDRELALRELRLLKDNGFNFMRIHLKPAPSWYLDLADEMGILIMHEPPTGWIANSPETASRCLREVTELIERDINHPSIISWCLLNESFHLLGYTPMEIYHLSRDLMERARELDPSRLIINASGGDARTVAGGPDTMIHDTSIKRQAALTYRPWDDTPHPIADDHIYCRYPAALSVEKKYRETTAGDLPLLISEFGAPETPPDFEKVLAGYSQEERDRGLEDCQLHVDFLASLKASFDRAGLDITLNEFIQQTSQTRADELRSIVHAIRSNPDVSGYCFCQLADASGEMFGATDIWRNPKPTLASYAEGIANPAIGLSLDNRIYRSGDKPLATVSLVADDDRKIQGTVKVSVADENQNILWSQSLEVSSDATSREIFQNRLPVDLAPGHYRAQTSFQGGDGTTSRHALDLTVLGDPPTIGPVGLRTESTVLQEFLEARSPRIESFGNNFRHKEMPVLLDIDPLPTNRGHYRELYGQLHKIIALGGCAILLNPEVHALYKFLFPTHIRPQSMMRTCGYTRIHPIFDGLPSGGAVTPCYANLYQGVGDHAGDILEAGGEIMAGAFSMNMWSHPAEYYWGAQIYRVPIGLGNVLVCHYDLSKQVEHSPAAQHMMLNLVHYATSLIKPGGDEHLLSRCIDPLECVA